MTQKIIALMARRIKDPYLLAAILSVTPVTEIKASILYAASSGAKAWLAALCAFLSSVLLAAAQSVLLPKLFGLSKKHPRSRRVMFLLTERIAQKADELLKRSKDKEDRSERLFLGVFCFVALPFPLTGIWAGAFLATLLKLDAKRTFFALTAGNFTAGGIVLAVAVAAGNKASLLLDAFFIVALLIVLVSLSKNVVSKELRHKRKTI